MISGIGFNVKKFNFPCGEMQVQIFLEDKGLETADVIFEFEKNEDIVELMLVSDALRRMGINLGVLHIPYVPFSRQDRVNARGESLSLKVFCDLVNSLNYTKVWVSDPHSDVTSALLDRCFVKEQYKSFESAFEDKKDFYLISPDAGALKKIYKLAKLVNPLDVIECTKVRNTMNGEITGVKVHASDLEGRDCFIVDDICDGGRTFIEIAKKLKEINCGKITLMVTHGFFTKGLEVFDGIIDEVITMKGRVK